MAIKPNNVRENIVTTLSIGLYERQRLLVAQKGIKPEHFRKFIDDFDRYEQSQIESGDWRRLRSCLENNPSLQLVGNINSGKSFLTQNLIRNDPNHLYIVLDAHQEYDWLPSVSNITPDLQKSCRIEMPKAPGGAEGMFDVYRNLIMNNKFPAHYILVVEEALRYQSKGIKKLLAESRKFLKVLAVTQERLVTFCPHIQVKPFNEFRV